MIPVQCTHYTHVPLLGADYIEVEHLHLHSLLSSRQLQNVTSGFFLAVEVLSIRSLRFKLPDLSHWTFCVSLDGVHVVLKQKAMPPQVCAQLTPPLAFSPFVCHQFYQGACS